MDTGESTPAVPAPPGPRGPLPVLSGVRWQLCSSCCRDMKGELGGPREALQTVRCSAHTVPRSGLAEGTSWQGRWEGPPGLGWGHWACLLPAPGFWAKSHTWGQEERPQVPVSGAQAAWPGGPDPLGPEWGRKSRSESLFPGDSTVQRGSTPFGQSAEEGPPSCGPCRPVASASQPPVSDQTF